MCQLFSIFSVFWLRTTISRSYRLSWWSFPVLPLKARLPWVSLRVLFAVDISCRPGVEGGFLTVAHHHPAQLHEGSNTWVPRNLPPGLCGTGFWPWFSPWPFAWTFLPFSDSWLKVDSFVFSPALHRCPLSCPCPMVGIHHLCFHLSSGRF